MKLKLRDEAGQTVDIGHGEYTRQFNRADQPFTVSEEEGVLLLGTGVFETVQLPTRITTEVKAPPHKKTKE